MGPWSRTLTSIVIAAVGMWAGVSAVLKTSFASKERPVSVIGPLLIQNESEWNHFKDLLHTAKKAGVDSVSTDVWMGIVQADSPDTFNWTYYERLSKTIREAGLKWVPILSTHACGGNVGDSVNIPLPKWLWTKGEHFISEGGNANLDYVSYWDTPKVLPYYKRFYSEFSRHFGSEASNIPEVIISLGPSGEIHYPSYHSHDRNLSLAGYPNRGAMQASSEGAKKSFREGMLAKYGSLAGINRAWNTSVQSLDEVSPPLHFKETQALFDTHLDSQYAQDLFDWYRETVIQHMKQMLGMTGEVFNKGEMKNAAIGIKIPGVHWRMDTRAAELTTGLLSLNEKAEWNDVRKGLGYNKIFETLAEFSSKKKVHVYYTAGATPNGNKNSLAASRAQDLTEAISTLAKKYNLSAGIENALAADVTDTSRIKIIENLIKKEKFGSISLLRIEDVMNSRNMVKTIQKINRLPPRFSSSRCVIRHIAP